MRDVKFGMTIEYVDEQPPIAHVHIGNGRLAAPRSFHDLLWELTI